MSNRKTRVLILTIAISLATAVVCKASRRTAVRDRDQTETLSKPSLNNLGQLVNALKRRGEKIVRKGKVEQPFFSVQGRIITVGDQDVQVFEYRTVSAAARDAGKLSPKGSSVGISVPRWIAPPHFFKSGRLIVLYVGDNAHVVEALTDVLGPQFAGK